MLHWQPPAELPDLRRVGIIALDTETKDGGLLADRGSGWPFGDGYICGICVAYRADGEIRAHYFPLRHPDSQNFDREQVFRWLRDHVDSGVHIITQNGGLRLGVAAHRGRHQNAALRAARRDRRARDHRRREPL